MTRTMDPEEDAMTRLGSLVPVVIEDAPVLLGLLAVLCFCLMV